MFERTRANNDVLAAAPPRLCRGNQPQPLRYDSLLTSTPLPNCRGSVAQADFAFYACNTASSCQGFIGPERRIPAPVSSAIAAETIPDMVSALGSMQRLREHHNCAAACA